LGAKKQRALVTVQFGTPSNEPEDRNHNVVNGREHNNGIRQLRSLEEVENWDEEHKEWTEGSVCQHFHKEVDIQVVENRGRFKGLLVGSHAARCNYINKVGRRSLSLN
jgi:hypothetical protein